MDKGISMNGQPMGGTVSMNGQSLPVAQATPATTMNGNGVNGTNMMSSPSYPMHEQEKMGSKCCGCCCDFRRAVIILDVILMIFSGLSLITIALPANDLPELEDLDDDKVLDELDDMMLVNSIISGVGLICMAVPVYGAMKYNVPMIGYGVFWLVATFVASIIVGAIYINKANDVNKEGESDLRMPFFNWIVAGVVTGLYIYPHAGLISEINKGIMSQETYPREEYSCCCGAPGR